MTFLRTDVGLSNQAVFLGVDFIVYVEGREAIEGRSQPSDEMFWSSLVGRFQQGWTYTFKGIGGKPALLDVARKIDEGGVDHSIVCMDADYDEQHDGMIIHPRVLYTYGYSWENDVICCDALKEIVFLMSAAQENNNEIETDYRNAVEILRRVGNRIGPLDVECQRQGMPVQNKEKPGELLELRRNSVPRFCISRLVMKLAMVKERCHVENCNKQGYDFMRSYHGKTILFASYHIAFAISHKYGHVGNISLDIFKHNLLRFFSRHFVIYSESLKVHYEQMISAVA